MGWTWTPNLNTRHRVPNHAITKSGQVSNYATKKPAPEYSTAGAGIGVRVFSARGKRIGPVFSLWGCGGGALELLSYETGDAGVTITDCEESAEGEVVIPDEIAGLPVISIGFEAFIGCSNLTSIIIPDGGVAFYACYSIADSASQVPKWDNSYVGDS